MSAWDDDELRLREIWAATPAPSGLRAAFHAAVAGGAAPPRRTLRPLAVAVGVAVVLAAGGVAFGAHRLSERRATSSPPLPTGAPRVSTPPPAPTGAPTPTNVSGGSWLTGRLDDGAVVDMALSPSAVYALVTAPGVSGDTRSSTELVRIDRVTGARSSTSPMALATSVAVVGGNVWVGMGGSLGGAPSSPQVVRLEPKTLLATGTTALHTTGASAGGPDLTVHLAAGAGQAFAVYGPDLFELDPTSGAVLRTTALGGVMTAWDIAVSPRGDRVYTSAADATLQTSTVAEWDAAGGQPAGGGSAVLHGLGPVRLAATDAGVWLSQATGSLGGVSFQRSGQLGSAGTTAQPSVPHSNQVHVLTTANVPGGILWILDAGTLTCADPASGTVRASTAVDGAVTVVADGTATYLGSTGGVDLLRPDARCNG